MVSKKRLKKYFEKRWKGILKNTSTLAEIRDSKALHDLRLHIKKAKAVSELLKSAGKHPEEYSTRLLKPVFKETGKIRVAELNLKNFKEAGFSNKGLEQEQKCAINKGYVMLCIKQKEYKKNTKELRKKLEKSMRDLKNKKVNNYYSDTINQLAISFLLPIDIDDLHDNRKKMKNLMYAAKVLPGKLQQKISLNAKFIDQLQEDIGQWHDLTITSGLLSCKELNHDPAYSVLKNQEARLLECIKNDVELFDQKIRNGKKNTTMSQLRIKDYLSNK